MHPLIASTEVQSLIQFLANQPTDPLTTLLDRTAPGIYPPRVKIDISSIAGRGLFTTQFITRGQILTYYPADLVVYQDLRLVSCHCPLTEDQLLGCPRLADYAYAFDYLNQPLLMLAHPELPVDLSYAGHLINDGAKMGLSIDDYLESSFSEANVIFLNFEGVVAVVALYDLEPNEELLVSYGPQYWGTRK